MVAAVGLKLWHRGHLKWHDLPTEFYTKKIAVDSGQTHRQDGDLISLHSSLQEGKYTKPVK